MKGILLGNLGTPLKPTRKEVGKYLREFLMDPLVIDIPWLLRWLLVNFVITPFRSKHSAKAYQIIWMQEGSPLLHYSKKQKEELVKILDFPIALGMNYGEPNVQSALRELIDQEVNEVLCLLLYPHYALSSYETLQRKITKVASECSLKSLQFVAPFYDHPSYIRSLSEVIEKNLPDSYDHLLFSYHGIPESHIFKTDMAGFCKIDENCCENLSKSHNFCYRAQVTTTTKLVASKLGVGKEKYTLSFQSRLGREPWLTPYTDHVIPILAQAKGIKNLVVVCPSFVSDCLETLEEIGIRAKKEFLEAGGKQLLLLPCLNHNSEWTLGMSEIIREHL